MFNYFSQHPYPTRLMKCVETEQLDSNQKF